MDYVVGSVAALISGNVTPNRPKLIRRALTPTKHQASPNVTPKSELPEDRSIFLSPTQQKKKAIVKKSPKRIFQNPDLDVTEDCEGNSSLTSPKAEKVKKHLKEELEADNMGKKKPSSQKSPSDKLDKASDEISPKKKAKIVDNTHVNDDDSPRMKKKKRNSDSNAAVNDKIDDANVNTKTELVASPDTTENNVKSSKKMMQRRKSVAEISDVQIDKQEAVETSKSPKKQKKTNPRQNDLIENKIETQEVTNQNEKKKNKKSKKKNKKIEQSEAPKDDVVTENKENKFDQETTQPDKQSPNKKKKKNRKNKSKQAKQTTEIEKATISNETDKMEVEDQDDQSETDTENVKSKNIPNPNAITEKDSDSEHDSDYEMQSENEETNEKILTKENHEHNESSDEEKEEEEKKIKVKNSEKKEKETVLTEDEVKRTLFVGNVPFSSKCKKEIKKIFNKYGQIETIRIRTIPVKDARVTPKLAVIRNELHPERTTVNVYVKYADAASINKALAENNNTLNGNHLRVSRSESTGAEHDPRRAVFVGNLPFAVEDETLRAKFERCGDIDSVRIIRDKKTNAGKGFGYVNFASKDGVELALAMSEEDLTIKNRILRVKRCTQAQSQGGKPGGKWNQGRQGKEEGAARRIMHKRKQQDSGGDGPPSKRQNLNQPHKEKKPRKEFVGVTSEKKKKQKFNKGQKKKKALSEILTKKP